jgi:biotin carboxyl carrier protein
METYVVRVNGTEYEVEVEKVGGDARSEAAPAAQAGAAKAAGAAKPKKAPAKKSAGKGEPVICGTAGNVWKIVASEGDEVKAGDSILILEAMKMEIPVVAPVDGTVSSIVVSEGEATTAGMTVAYVE